jgi:hypothetical protein
MEAWGLALAGITIFGLGLFLFLNPESGLANWVARHLIDT